MRDALLAARRIWLSRFESPRQDDAHRRHDGDAVRRAVCSAARTGACGAPERARNDYRQITSVLVCENRDGNHPLPRGTQPSPETGERSGVLLGSPGRSGRFHIEKNGWMLHVATAAHPLLPPRVSKRDYAQSASRHSLPRRLPAPGPATLPSFSRCELGAVSKRTPGGRRFLHARLLPFS